MNNFNEVTRRAFKLPAGTEVRDDMSPADIPQWDSMNYLFFIAELEKEFNMSFTMDEVMNAKHLGDVRSIVDARAKPRTA